MGKKNRRNRRVGRSEDDIMDEINQKSQQLNEVQDELKTFRRMWSDAQENNDPSNESSMKAKEAPEALSAIAAVEKKCEAIESSFKTSLIALNEMRQYMHRQNIIIGKLHGVPMNKYDHDFVVWISDKLNEILPPMKFGKINPDDINDAHPLYIDEKTKQPTVIVQFNKRWIRNEIYKVRKAVQEQTGVRITEHLTKHNRDMLNQARDIVGGYYAWSQKGVVYASVDDETKIPIRSSDDIKKLQTYGCVPRPPPVKKVKKNIGINAHSYPPQTYTNNSNSTLQSSQVNNMIPSQTQSNLNSTDNVHNSYDFVPHQSVSINNVRGRGYSRGRGTLRGRGSYYQRGQNSRGHGFM